MRRKPPCNELVNAIKRVQIFSAALVERLTIQHLQEKGVDIQTPGTIVFHEPRDQRVLECMLQISPVIPSQLQGSRFPSTLLLLLWLAECRVSELGYILEGEVGLPYPTLGKQLVYKAEFPLCLYPTTCLSCGRLLQGEPQQRFCTGTCRSDWSTLKEQFARISHLASVGESVVDEYGTVLNAYSLFSRNPNYLGYQSRNLDIQSRWPSLVKQDVITLFRNEQGEPVDLQGNSLPKAELITDIEDILA